MKANFDSKTRMLTSLGALIALFLASGCTQNDGVSSVRISPVTQNQSGSTTDGATTGDDHSTDGDDDGEQHRGDLRGRCHLEDDEIDAMVITSGQKTVSVPATKSAAILVTGNQSNVTLNLESDQQVTLPKLCLLVTGNQSVVSLNINVPVTALYYEGHGNQSKTTLTVGDKGDLTHTFEARLSGNQPLLTVGGTGKYNCPAETSEGNGAQVQCHAH